jgi:2,4-dienoyl-CoA reductase-like NADH-dependent reductase (Old Yellow Enzyme family)
MVCGAGGGGAATKDTKKKRKEEGGRRKEEGNILPPFLTRFRLRELILPNRVVVSPMCQYTAEDGVPNDWHMVHLGTRAMGGAGLVMTEMTDVSAEGRISPGCTGMWADALVAGWRRIVEFVRRHAPETRSACSPGTRGGRRDAAHVGGRQPAAPRRGVADHVGLGARVAAGEPGAAGMTRADMDRVRDEFVRAAERTVEAGFDVLEVHLAHGYLLASFISPLTNIRTDEYGASLEHRLRYPLEVVKAVRAVWPAERPLTARISATDWHSDDSRAGRRWKSRASAGRAGVDAWTSPRGDHSDPAGVRAGVPDAVRRPDRWRDGDDGGGNIQSHEDAGAISRPGRRICLDGRATCGILLDPRPLRSPSRGRHSELDQFSGGGRLGRDGKLGGCQLEVGRWADGEACRGDHGCPGVPELSGVGANRGRHLGGPPITR